jgi:hypothetical protein
MRQPGSRPNGAMWLVSLVCPEQRSQRAAGMDAPYRAATPQTVHCSALQSGFAGHQTFWSTACVRGGTPLCCCGSVSTLPRALSARGKLTRAPRTVAPRPEKPNMKRLRAAGETWLAATSSWKASNDFCWTRIGTRHPCNPSRQNPSRLTCLSINRRARGARRCADLRTLLAARRRGRVHDRILKRGVESGGICFSTHNAG